MYVLKRAQIVRDSQCKCNVTMGRVPVKNCWRETAINITYPLCVVCVCVCVCGVCVCVCVCVWCVCGCGSVCECGVGG